MNYCVSVALHSREIMDNYVAVLMLKVLSHPLSYHSYREQGWCSGDSTGLLPMWLGIDSWTRNHTWVEFVVGSLLYSERFFSRYSGFPLSSKTNLSKFKFDPDFSVGIATLWRCYCKFPLSLVHFVIHAERDIFCPR